MTSCWALEDPLQGKSDLETGQLTSMQQGSRPKRQASIMRVVYRAIFARDDSKMTGIPFGQLAFGSGHRSVEDAMGSYA